MNEKIKISWEDVSQAKIPEKNQIYAKKQMAFQNLPFQSGSKKNNLSRVIAGIALLIALGIISGWFSFSIIEKRAISRVMDKEIKLKKEIQNSSENLTPSQRIEMLKQYCDNFQKLDISDCPANFKIALKHYMSALQNFLEEIQKLPTSFAEGFVMGFFNKLLRGELDGGISRLENNFKQALNRVNTTWEEVEKIAAQYGVAK